MGSSSSKSAPSSSSSAAGGRRTRSKAHRVLQSSCLGTTSRSRRFDDNAGDQVCDDRGKENVSNVRSRNHSGADLHQGKIGCYGKFKVGQSDELPCISSNAEIREWGQANVTDTASAIGSSSARAASTQSMNPSNRFLSRFSFVPGNMSFRLSRANSLGSSESYPISSTNLMLNNEDDVNLQRGTASGFVDRDYRGQGIEQIPVSLVSDIRASALYCEEASGNLRLRSRAGFPINSRDDQASSCPQDAGRNGSGSGLGVDANLCSPRILSEMESVGARVSDRNVGGREPIERNVRFSRTLSVGRLRDRVLRRSSLSDISFCPVQQVEEVRDADRGSEARAWAGQTRTISSEASEVASSNSSAFPSSNVSSSLFGIQDYQIETSRSREPRYHDLLEHRSNFLERRRRIRSQVRALQRLGNRFDNLSGHERNCILSGQHRTGRCTCRNSNRDPHLNDDTSARASISRIVMLAEALFEVLDEIHQQSVVLSSRPSVSSIGSVPAPSEAVESLPVKTYTKLQKHQNEEVAQCYICLVEYEEGDRMRVLPCQHEFHKTCVDKWLKEIHRVCPLCRGDICRSDSLPAEN